MATPRATLLTGGTGLVGSAVLAQLARGSSTRRVYVLVRDMGRWHVLASRLGLPLDRVRALRGDVNVPGLGLAAADRAVLVREASAVIHAAADTTFSRTLEEARRINTAGTANVLEVATSWSGLERFALVSTAFVAGRRAGVVNERDNGGDAGWVNAYEQSKYEAERLVREAGGDWLIFRPSTIVCDSVAGTVSQLNAVHRALRLYHRGLASMMPGTETTPVDVVPLDYVAGAIARACLRPDLARRTLHLCAGRGALSLGELLDTTYAVWAARPEWRQRGIPRPALTDLATYQLFEQAVEDAGDPRLAQVTRSLAHFVPQLAFAKQFSTITADSALGASAPAVRTYWTQVVESLLATNWKTTTAHHALRTPRTAA